MVPIGKGRAKYFFAELLRPGVQLKCWWKNALRVGRMDELSEIHAFCCWGISMARPSLTAQQQAEVERLLHLLREKTDQDLRELAELLVRKEDGELFGATEFEVRDLVHGIGAKALATTLAERKKRGTTAPAASAPGA